MKQIRLFAFIACFLGGLIPSCAIAQSTGNVDLPSGFGAITPSVLSNAINNALSAKADASNGVFTNPTIIGGTIASLSQPAGIGVGGTGSNTVAGAQVNLGIPALISSTLASPPCIGCTTPNFGNFTGIATPSISGLSTQITVQQGGTGSPTAAGALVNLGALSSKNPTVSSGNLTLSGGAIFVNGSTSGLVQINAGTADNQALTAYQAQGTNKWSMGLQTDDSFVGWDYANLTPFYTVTTTGNTGVGEAGKVVTINGTVAISGGNINGTVVGGAVPDIGAFTTLSASGPVSGAGFTALLAPYAPLASPAFTGAPTAPAAALGTNTTQLANTEFVQATFASPPAAGYGSTAPAPVTASTLNASGNDALSYTNISGQTIASGADITVTGWTKTFDRLGTNFNASTGTFTAPAAGIYQVSGQIGYAAATNVVGSNLFAIVLANGVQVAQARYVETTTASAGATLLIPTTDVSLGAGQTIVIQLYQSTGSSLALGVSAGVNVISINRIP